MEFYILKSGICLAIFYGFYKLVLEKESFHIFKRFYLLVSVVLAFVIPLITFTEYIEVIPQEVPLFFPDIPITNTIIEAEPINYLPIILWSIYGFGVLLFSFKFLKNLSGIIFKIKRNPKFKNQSFINVLLQDLVIPHTFLSYIFLNKHKFETHQIPKEVLLHEETHAKQKHSLDVLFIEILQILFWFNPFIYFIKRSIKLNHEFLADQAVINNGVTHSTYQQILLAFSSNATEPLLANAINYSSIKKRFTVMKTHTSKQAFWLRSLILLPLLAILIYSFSEKNVVEEPFVVQQNIKTHGATETMMTEYRDFINAFERSNKIIYPKYLKAVAIYDLMTEEQLNSVKKYPKDIIPDLSNVKPKIPTEAEFNSWKNSNKFAIWIDGNHIKNSELNNYKASDIKYFANSFVHNNARGDKFPQPYQNHLYTQKGFETTFTNSKKDNMSAFLEIKKELLKESSFKESEKNEILITINEKGDVLVNNSLVEINELAESLNVLTKDFSSEEKENIVLNLIAFKEVPTETITKVKTILREAKLLQINLIKTQQKATPEEIKEYNEFAKKFNSKPVKERIIKVKDKNRIEYIYSLMTAEQKKENESFPDFSTVPPPPIPYNASKNLETYIKEKNKVTNYISKKITNYPYGFLELSESEQKEFTDLYMIMYSAFTNMSESEKQSAPKILPPPPDAKMYKLENGKLVKKQNVPPPPPIEKETDDHSKESLEARKKFLEKANTYGEAMQVYFKEKKGNLDDLKKQYKEVMELYNSYQKLLEKENLLPPPPPPPVKN